MLYSNIEARRQAKTITTRTLLDHAYFSRETCVHAHGPVERSWAEALWNFTATTEHEGVPYIAYSYWDESQRYLKTQMCYEKAGRGVTKRALYPLPEDLVWEVEYERDLPA